MDADHGKHIGVLLSQGQRLVVMGKGAGCPDHHETRHARSPGAFEQRLAVGLEFVVGQMTVRVDQHV